MKPVDSSTISEIGYDPITKVLRVGFNSGGTYDYDDVEEAIWHSFITASSVGSYFHKRIRGTYSTRKIS